MPPARACQRTNSGSATGLERLAQNSLDGTRSRLTTPAANVRAAPIARPNRGAASAATNANSNVMITAPVVWPTRRAVPCMPPAAALRARWLERFVDFYLSDRRTCELGEACALQALTPEVSRGTDAVKAAFEEHMLEVLNAVAGGLEGRTSQERLAKAWALLSLLSGGVTLARAVADPAQSKAIASGIRKAALWLATGREAPVSDDRNKT